VATYRDAIQWIAHNNATEETPQSMAYSDAFGRVYSLVTVRLVADVFGMEQAAVTADILKARGFRKPRIKSVAILK